MDLLRYARYGVLQSLPGGFAVSLTRFTQGIAQALPQEVWAEVDQLRRTDMLAARQRLQAEIPKRLQAKIDFDEGPLTPPT